MVASERASTSARRWIVRLIVVTALCTAVPGHAVESDTDPEAAADPDYVAGKKAIATQNWNAAIKSFTSAAQRAPDNADIQNYLGYAHRKGGQLDTAFRHYKRALELNPRHKGAHEYIGEAYLMAGDPASARKHLEELRNICLLPCEELSDLEKALAEYRAKPRKETR